MKTEFGELQPHIRSYILRRWPKGEKGSRQWPVSLFHLPNGERIGFADIDSAFQFLRKQLAPPVDDERKTLNS